MQWSRVLTRRSPSTATIKDTSTLLSSATKGANFQSDSIGALKLFVVLEPPPPPPSVPPLPFGLLLSLLRLDLMPWGQIKNWGHHGFPWPRDDTQLRAKRSSMFGHDRRWHRNHTDVPDHPHRAVQSCARLPNIDSVATLSHCVEPLFPPPLLVCARRPYGVALSMVFETG